MSWPLVRLGDICNFVRGPFGGALKKESFVEDGFAVYEQQHAIYNQFSDIRYYIDSDKFEDLKRFELHAGDIIMSCSGTMGKVAVVPDGIKQGIINQALLKLTPNCNLDIAYFMHWLKSESFQFQLGLSSHGAAIKNVASVKVLKELEIPLPPLEEQKRIAAILDKADAIRQKRKQAIELADEFLRSVFLDMFGDPVTNPKGWEVRTMKDLVKIQGGYAFKSKDFLKKGIPVVKIGNANKLGFTTKGIAFVEPVEPEKLKQYELYAGDLLMSLTGTVGKDDYANITQVHDEYDMYYLNQRVAKITVDERLISKNYLKYFLAHPKVKSEITKNNRGVRQANISNSDIYGLSVTMPSQKLLERFDTIVAKANLLKERTSPTLQLKTEFFESLSQKAFSGQL